MQIIDHIQLSTYPITYISNYINIPFPITILQYASLYVYAPHELHEMKKSVSHKFRNDEFKIPALLC